MCFKYNCVSPDAGFMVPYEECSPAGQVVRILRITGTTASIFARNYFTLLQNSEFPARLVIFKKW